MHRLTLTNAVFALAFFSLGAGGNEVIDEVRSADAVAVQVQGVPRPELEPPPPALISSAWWVETEELDTPRALAPTVQLVHPPAVSVAPVPIVAPVAVAASPAATPQAAVALALRVEVPAPVAPTSGEAAVRAALAQSSWPASLWPWVLRVAACESGLRANPRPGDGGKSIGLMQINTAWNAHPDLVHRFDLTTLAGNLEAAWIVFTQRGGASAWTCK